MRLAGDGDNEEWRDVVGYEDRYQVSSLGRVKSKSYMKSGRNASGVFSFWTKPQLIKLQTNPDGYLVFDIRKDRGRKTGFVHVLVAQAFIQNPHNKPQVNHKNSNRADARVANLEWVTASENIRHGHSHGLANHKGIRHPRAKLNDELVKLIREMSKTRDYKVIACELGLNKHTVWKVIKRINWRHVE